MLLKNVIQILKCYVVLPSSVMVYMGFVTSKLHIGQSVSKEHYPWTNVHEWRLESVPCFAFCTVWNTKISHYGFQHSIYFYQLVPDDYIHVLEWT